MDERIAKVEQKLDDHIAWAQSSGVRNDKTHERLERKLDDAMVFQHRLRWTIGVASTMLGIILMIIYHYLPWIWDSLPKHGHTH